MNISSSKKLQNPTVAISIVMLLSTMLCVKAVMSVQTESGFEAEPFQQVPGIYEPSGVIQLDDGRILAVEDEPQTPFVVLTPAVNKAGFETSKLQLNVLFNPAMRRISDLEGIAKSPDGRIVAITSQSRKSNGKRDSQREKIIRFSIEKGRVTKATVRTDFRKALIKSFPVLKDASKTRKVKDDLGLNIEGLTFNPHGNTLWIGLRAPLIGDKAILIGLLNPHTSLESREAFLFAKDPVLLDLEGGGIRDIVYDPILSGYLILSQREHKKKERAFKLWLWSGNASEPPSRVKLLSAPKLKRTEGIAPVRINGKDQLLLLNDDGSRYQEEPASYILIDYAQLEIDTI